jgi:hypothetical protein
MWNLDSWVQSIKLKVFKYKTGIWIMSKKIIVALIYRHHKLSDLIYVTSTDLLYVYVKCSKFERVKIQPAKISYHLTFLVKGFTLNAPYHVIVLRQLYEPIGTC